jgi:hypothetical protein
MGNSTELHNSKNHLNFKCTIASSANSNKEAKKKHFPDYLGAIHA